MPVDPNEDIPRCPFCAVELDPPDTKICLNCGYDLTSRKRHRTVKTYALTGGDYFKWWLPAIIWAFVLINCAWPIVLNAANEVAVDAFLAGRIAFPAIPATIEKALAAADRATSFPRSLEDVRAADAWAREFSIETLSTLRSS